MKRALVPSVGNAMASEDLVQQIKDLQRSDQEAKAQWWAYCDSEGAGVRDPAKHKNGFVQSFLSSYNSGVRYEVSKPEVGAGGDAGDLAGFIKEGQRKSQPFRNAWGQYVSMNGNGKNDPTLQTPAVLVGFLDYIGTAANMMSGMSAMSGGMGKGMPMAPAMMGMGMGGGFGGMAGGFGGMGGGFGGGFGGAMMNPTAKKARLGGVFATGDAMKDTLVAKIKAYQRGSEEDKQNWWAHCDSELGGVKDPSKHDVATLKNFIDSYGL
mmetsp:Transcript_62168/g.108747  ORF Transcript_62168/g.108747 Transcript_62168/m.108747 type:complete len:266 (-) Transcript_62168:79-876(-)